MSHPYVLSMLRHRRTNSLVLAVKMQQRLIFAQAKDMWRRCTCVRAVNDSVGRGGGASGTHARGTTSWSIVTSTHTAKRAGHRPGQCAYVHVGLCSSLNGLHGPQTLRQWRWYIVVRWYRRCQYSRVRRRGEVVMSLTKSFQVLCTFILL